ncbi:hypothetical protein [Achromobacter xylosoxidans]|uniref:hypothetical protein n=1 Tax=Alcaligenes xylosoxydans xylosoxydans TaxID=85698 RepID=UPI001ED8D483|nr:hypothetical protein [Achromobacter xylosoxidans]
MYESDFWYSVTMRARTVPAAFSGVVRSADPRYWFQDPMPALTSPVNSRLLACLRTRLIEAEGLPAPVIRPVAPRTTSMRS